MYDRSTDVVIHHISTGHSTGTGHSEVSLLVHTGLTTGGRHFLPLVLLPQLGPTAQGLLTLLIKPRAQGSRGAGPRRRTSSSSSTLGRESSAAASCRRRRSPPLSAATWRAARAVSAWRHGGARWPGHAGCGDGAAAPGQACCHGPRAWRETVRLNRSCAASRSRSFTT